MRIGDALGDRPGVNVVIIDVPAVMTIVGSAAGTGHEDIEARDPPSWRLRIVRRGKPMGVRIEGGGFTTYEAARLVGGRALADFLEELAAINAAPYRKRSRCYSSTRFSPPPGFGFALPASMACSTVAT
jgi:hypothetical protein